MKAAKTWCLAGLLSVAGLCSVSCGQDEAAGGGGHGTVIGGSGGSGGGSLIGRSGSGGTDSAGGQGPTAATKLGRACVTAKDCVDPDAPGLTCVTATDTVLANGAPPKGLCTTTCTVPQGPSDPDTCAALGPDALCYPFNDSSDQGYCVEGCSFGAPDIGEVKCHNRSEFACNPALLGRTDAACGTDDDCPSGEVCGTTGFCDVVFPACLPSCRGDLDCEPGMYCDQSFLSGVCVAEQPTGKALGEPCTVPADGDPREPDGCLGFCQADSDTGNKGHCAASCGLARQCSWNASTKKFDGICFYASRIDQNAMPDVGDFGFCTPSCNCTDECQDPSLACSLLTQGALSSDFRGAGLCFAPDAMTKEYNQCTGAGGAGATGGVSGTDSAGAGGVPGDTAGGAGGAAP